MKNLKLTILHTNDIHNQLYFKIDSDYVIHGGISLLSSYVKKCRQEGNTLFTISGDVLQEDITESDYKGINTISVINHLKPNAISLGNHELDYGLEHLLIFKECIDAPLLNANISVNLLNKELFIKSKIFNINGIKVLALGVIPEAFYKRIVSDVFCKNVLDYNDSYSELRNEIAKYSKNEYDIVVLLSHYGYDGDIHLAENMPSDINIDVILGGHSHIKMDEALVVNNILIAQSSFGTSDIGRFDLEIDTENKHITSWKWERVEITNNLVDFDFELDSLADNTINRKKKLSRQTVLCSFKEEYKNDSRVLETPVGDIIADAFLDLYSVDFVILQSGSLRKDKLPLSLTVKDLKELYPFDDEFYSVEITGANIENMFKYLFSVKPDGSVMNGTFQYSKGFSVKADGTDWKNKGVKLESISVNSAPLQLDKKYRVGITKNALTNFVKYFGVEKPYEEGSLVVHSLSTYHDLQYWFLSQKEEITAPPQNERFIFSNFEI